MSDVLLIEMIFVMSDICQAQVFLKCLVCQAQVSACQIKPYLVISLSIYLLGFVGVAYIFYETQLLWLIINSSL